MLLGAERLRRDQLARVAKEVSPTLPWVQAGLNSSSESYSIFTLSPDWEIKLAQCIPRSGDLQPLLAVDPKPARSHFYALPN